MMQIVEVCVLSDRKLLVTAEDGRCGEFDLTPWLQLEAFLPLLREGEINRIINGGYYLEWPCGVDISADSVEAGWTEVGNAQVI